MLNSEPICVMTKIAYLCLLFTLNDRPFYNRTNIRSTGSHLPGLMNFSNTGAFYLSLWMGHIGKPASSHSQKEPQLITKQVFKIKKQLR